MSYKRLDQMNNISWQSLLDNNLVNNFCEEAYSIHCNLFVNDYNFEKNKQFLDFDYQIKDCVIEGLAQNKYGYERTQTYTTDKSNDLSVLKFDKSSKQVEFVKKTLSLSECVVHMNIQESGNTIPVHVDMNRSITQLCKDKDIYPTASNIKKYIWFLEDQEIGQFFAVGRQNVSWKSGDIISWPWYMPHATANASSRSRKILFISGVDIKK